MTRCYLSNAIGFEKNAIIQEDITFGKAHYSWKIIANLYETSLSKMGITIKNVKRPEIFQTDIARKTLDVQPGDFHLSIKPIEEIRYFEGIPNYFVCGWEFAEYPDHSIEGNPFYNFQNILKKADKILCWTNYQAQNLQDLNIKAEVLPPAIITDLPSAVQKDSLSPIKAWVFDTMKKPDDIDTVNIFGYNFDNYAEKIKFLAILNPFDKRKNFGAMIEAFHAFAQDRDDVVLFVKIISDEKRFGAIHTNEFLKTKCNIKGQSDNIIFFSDLLSSLDMNTLYSLVDFYLCSSSVEGLNLPIIEAMRFGVVPISTWNSAMGTYLSEHISYPIASAKVRDANSSNILSSYMPFTHYPTTKADVLEALHAAYQDKKQSPSLYQGKSDAAVQLVHNKFGQEAFEAQFHSIIGGDLEQ